MLQSPSGTRAYMRNLGRKATVGVSPHGHFGVYFYNCNLIGHATDLLWTAASTSIHQEYIRKLCAFLPCLSAASVREESGSGKSRVRWRLWKMSDARHQIHLESGFAFTLIATVNKLSPCPAKDSQAPHFASHAACHYDQMEIMRMQCCNSSLIHLLLSIFDIFTAVQFQPHPCQNPDDWPTMDLFLLWIPK